MTTAASDLWTNFRASLEGLAKRPFVVLALLLLVNAVVLPYRGLFHDARLYAAQIREHVEPGSMAGDLYLRYGSQDRYSIFSALMVPLARGVGLEGAFFLGYLASKVLFFAALLRLVFALVPERVPALAALVYLAMAPLPFGGNEVFHLNEPFLTPRIASCGLVLLALERALAKRMAISLFLCVLAMTLHPLMAFGGLLVVVTAWALRRLSWRLFAALVGLAVLAGTLCVTVEPLGRRLFGHMDDEWHEVYMQLCFFIDPVAWTLGDWSRIALAVAMVGITAWITGGEELRFRDRAVAGRRRGLRGHPGGGPFAPCAVASSLAVSHHLADRIAGHPARVPRLLAARRSGQGQSPGALTAAVLVVLLTTDWNRTLVPAALLLVSAGAVVLHRLPRPGPHTGPAGLGGAWPGGPSA